MRKIAIIGLGCAGIHAVRALREHGYQDEIHVFSDVAHPSANPMLTTYYVSGKIPRERMFPFGTLEKLQEEEQVILHKNTPVAHVRSADRKVVLQDGKEEFFDQILIATGARAVAPPLGQKNAGRTFLMRTVADADALKRMLDEGCVQSAAVVGASMVGIKVVELLHNRGIQVSMVDMAERLFPLACMKETADILEEDLRERGISLLLKRGVDHVEEKENHVRTFLTDGQCLETDILVLCIGTRANVELAANTEVVEGEPIQINRGIVVNERMETNIPGIYAAGDCCEALNLQTGKTMIIGLWANAAAQGETAGSNMAGVPARYPGSIPSNITHYFDETFIGIGDPNLEGERVLYRNKLGYVSAVYDSEQLRCVNILGNYRISGMVKDDFIRRITGEGEPMSIGDEGMLRSCGLPEGFLALLKS